MSLTLDTAVNESIRDYNEWAIRLTKRFIPKNENDLRGIYYNKLTKLIKGIGGNSNFIQSYNLNRRFSPEDISISFNEDSTIKQLDFSMPSTYGYYNTSEKSDFLLGLREALKKVDFNVSPYKPESIISQSVNNILNFKF